MFVYDRSYLFATSPLNILPNKNLEPVLTYLLPVSYTHLRNYRIHIILHIIIIVQFIELINNKQAANDEDVYKRQSLFSAYW